MVERREHRRAPVRYWATLKHPLVGTITGEIQDMSASGISIRLDDIDKAVFIMMELDVKIHGEGWDPALPPFPAQVVRVDENLIGMRFVRSCKDFWTPPEEEITSGNAALNNPLSELARLKRSA